LFVSCFDEIEFTKNGKTTNKTVYHGTYIIMESNHDKCPYCGKVGYIKYLYLGLETCFEQFEHCIKMAKCSPSNLALIGHVGGWQPFGTSYRGLGSFEVTVANMQKAARNHVDEVYVVECAPLFQVPNLPNGLDPFLHPLMNDL